MCGDTVTTLEPLLVGDVLGVNNLLKKSYNGQNDNVVLKRRKKKVGAELSQTLLSCQMIK